MNARSRRHAARAEARADARVTTRSLMSGPAKNRRGTKLTATQRNSEGRPSEWAQPVDFFTDPKWSHTCSTNRAV